MMVSGKQKAEGGKKIKQGLHWCYKGIMNIKIVDDQFEGCDTQVIPEYAVM